MKKVLGAIAAGMMASLAGVGHAQTVTFLHTDALGTPVAETDSSGNVIGTSEYTPYGDLLNRADGDGPGYTGHVEDATTGLTYMQQRYYDPGVGIFLSTDPVTALAGTSTSFNRYRYGNGNPYRFIDPDGRLAGIMRGIAGDDYYRDQFGDSHSCPFCLQVARTSLVSPIDTGELVPNRSPVALMSDPISKKRVLALDPKVQDAAASFMNESEWKGHPLRIVQGLRTVAEQNALYAQGRTAPGAIVTNARGGDSYHNYGLALDVAGLDASGSINWNIDYGAVSTIGKSAGFEWGGDFKSIKDRPHFQMTFGLSVSDLKEGDRP